MTDTTFALVAFMLLAAGCSMAAAQPDASPARRRDGSFEQFDRRASAGEPMNIVFFGGSLTWGANASDPQRTSYRARMGQYLQQRYPRSPMSMHDAAIGGTGSDLGIFRLERDVLSRDPDLVFLDFTLNDDLKGTDAARLASYESILRRLIERGIPVVQVFMCGAGEVGGRYAPAELHRYQDHLKLAAAYGTGVGDTLVQVQRQVEAGACDPQVLWPFDPVHPDDAGYEQFYLAVRAGFEQALAEKRTCRLPERPVFSDAFMTWRRAVLADGPLPAGWRRAKTYRTSLWFDGLSSRWMGDVALCDAKDAGKIQPLRIEFSGTFIGVFGEMDQDGLSFRASVDGKPLTRQEGGQTTDLWVANARRYSGGGTGRLFFWRALAENLPPGAHSLEIVPVIPQGAAQGQLRIESICSAGR